MFIVCYSSLRIIKLITLPKSCHFRTLLDWKILFDLALCTFEKQLIQFYPGSALGGQCPDQEDFVWPQVQGT